MRYGSSGNLYQLKTQAHDLLEKVFGSYNDLKSRARAYAWLQSNSRTGHLATMRIDEMEKVIKKLKQML